jgi:hypothetical protein
MANEKVEKKLRLMASKKFGLYIPSGALWVLYLIII